MTDVGSLLSTWHQGNIMPGTMSWSEVLQQLGPVLMSMAPDTIEGHAEAKGLGCHLGLGGLCCLWYHGHSQTQGAMESHV